MEQEPQSATRYWSIRMPFVAMHSQLQLQRLPAQSLRMLITETQQSQLMASVKRVAATMVDHRRGLE